MRRAAIAVLMFLIPLSVNAQTQTSAAPDSEREADSAWATTLAVTVGVIGAVVVADIASGGALSGTAMRAINWEGLALPPVSPTAAPLPKPWWRFW